MVRHRPRAGGRDVFLACKDQLHWLFGDVGQDSRLNGGVGPDPPAVPAAQKLLMNPDLVRCRLQDAGDDQASQCTELGAGPDIGRFAVLRNLCHRVHRLHLRVVRILRPIARFHTLDRAP